MIEFLTSDAVFYGLPVLLIVLVVLLVISIKRVSRRRYTRKDLERGMRRLSKLAHEQGQTIHIQIFGGGAMVLKFRSRPATRDLDVAIRGDREFVLQLVALVAEEFRWDADWLNDKVVNTLWGSSEGEQIFSAPGLIATIGSWEQLLANKLCAFRQSRDQDDALVLMRNLINRDGYQNMEAVWDAIWGHVRKGDERWARRNHIITWNQVTKEEVADDSKDFTW
jgi:hypothetical protein